MGGKSASWPGLDWPLALDLLQKAGIKQGDALKALENPNGRPMTASRGRWLKLTRQGTTYTIEIETGK